MKPVRPDSWSSLLLPPVCCLCRRVHRPVTDYPGICRSCLARLPLRFGPQQRLAGKDGESGVIAAAYYLPPVRDLLLRLKFSGAPQMSIALTGLLTQLVRRQVPDAAAVLAVPLHRRRLRERGYNQAGLLAGQLADALGLPDLSPVCCAAGKPGARVKRRTGMNAGSTWPGLLASTWLTGRHGLRPGRRAARPAWSWLTMS